MISFSRRNVEERIMHWRLKRFCLKHQWNHNNTSVSPSQSWGSWVELISHNISKQTLFASLTHTTASNWLPGVLRLKCSIEASCTLMIMRFGDKLHYILHILAEPIQCHELGMQHCSNKQRRAQRLKKNKGKRNILYGTLKQKVFVFGLVLWIH